MSEKKVLPGYCPASWDHKHWIGYPVAAICPFCGQEQQFIIDKIKELQRKGAPSE